jgi:hypothetical protein
MDNTNLIIAAKTVVVAGYGWCSRGIAMRAAALGANVIVTEINPVKAIEARMDGFQVMTMEKAAPLGDIFVSATGCCKTIAVKHMLMMKDGAILTNAGHFNSEVDMAGLEEAYVEKKEMRKNIMGYKLESGRWVNVIGDGRLVKALLSKDNIEWVPNVACTDFIGENELTGVEYKDKDGNIKVKEITGVFVAIGQVPDNKAFEPYVDLDKDGYIVAGEDCKTKTEGLFVAGDCRTKAVRQVATACADGAIAATNASIYIESLEN